MHVHVHNSILSYCQTLEPDVTGCRLLEELPSEVNWDKKSKEGTRGANKNCVSNKESAPQVNNDDGGVSRNRRKEEEREGEGEERWWRISLRYRHFRLAKIERLIHHCCQLLAFFGSSSVVLDHLIDMYRNSAHYQKELLIMIGHALIGAVGRGCVHRKDKVS